MMERSDPLQELLNGVFDFNGLVPGGLKIVQTENRLPGTQCSTYTEPKSTRGTTEDVEHLSELN